MSNERSNERSTVHYVKDGDQTERWRKEFIKNKEYEVSLAETGKIFYEEVDYTQYLEKEPFPELVLNNYDHLYGQFEREVEAKYFIPISGRIAVFFGLFIVLVIFFSMTMLLVVTISSGALAASLFYTKKQKKKDLEAARLKIDSEIKRRHAEETRLYNEAKAAHEEAENERVDSINKLLEGSEFAIGTRLTDAFKQLHWPVMVEVDISYHNKVPLAKIWLPAKAVVPQQVCELLNSGRLQFKDKEARVFHKQYFELCVSIVIQTALIILGNIPSFEQVYACGMSKGSETDDCLMTIRVDRKTAADAGRVASALNALQLMDSNYEINTNFFINPVEMIIPSEWGDVEIHNVYTIQVKIYK